MATNANKLVVDGDRLFAFDWFFGGTDAYLDLRDRRWVSLGLPPGLSLVAVDGGYIYVASQQFGIFRLPKSSLAP